jgi:hypothetical protein
MSEPVEVEVSAPVAMLDDMDVNLKKDLEEAVDAVVNSPGSAAPLKRKKEEKSSDATADGGSPVEPPKKKNPRFGRNSDGTLAKKADKKEIVRKSPWGKFLADFKSKNPDLCPVDATVEARKIYRPVNGKQKSFERIYTEVWKHSNPKWPLMDKKLRTERIRSDFIKAI